MRKYFLLSIVLFVAQSACYSNDIDAAKSLAKRIVPAFAPSISFSIISSPKDVFELKWQDNKLLISGNNANSMAVGLNYYLKYFCYTSVSWYSNDRIAIPPKMPALKETVRHEARCANRFMLNYCTFGYTMP